MSALFGAGLAGLALQAPAFAGQAMAQFAVNWVDHLDSDDNITLFEYDTDLTDDPCLDASIVECFVTRDLSLFRDMPKALAKGGTLVGGVLILLASAMGLTSYLVDAQIPDRLLAVIRHQIQSPLVFLLVLNMLLLVLGSVLEIYAAIVVLTPLLAPLGTAFGNSLHRLSFVAR